eukprot:gene13750-16250_t
MSVDDSTRDGSQSLSSAPIEHATRRVTFNFDDFPEDVLRLILDREGMNAGNARGTMRLFNRTIKENCRCMYDPATDTFVAPVLPTSNLERDTHCLSGTEVVLLTIFCQRLTDTWTELRDRMNEAMTVEQTGDRNAGRVFETIKDALPRERDPATTRLLLQAFGEYLVRCVQRPNPPYVGLANLWNVVLDNYRSNFRRAQFEFATAIEMLCDWFPQGFLIILMHYTDISRIPTDDLVFILSRVVTNAELTPIMKLTTIARIVGTRHEYFNKVFQEYETDATLNLQDVQHIRTLLGSTDERYVSMLGRCLDREINRTTQFTRSELAMICEDLGESSDICHRLLDTYIRRKLKQTERVVFDDVSLFCRLFPYNQEWCDLICSKFVNQDIEPPVREAKQLCDLLGNESDICKQLYNRLLQLKLTEDVEFSATELLRLCAFFGDKPQICDELVDKFVAYNLKERNEMSVETLKVVCLFFRKQSKRSDKMLNLFLELSLDWDEEPLNTKDVLNLCTFWGKRSEASNRIVNHYVKYSESTATLSSDDVLDVCEFWGKESDECKRMFGLFLDSYVTMHDVIELYEVWGKGDERCDKALNAFLGHHVETHTSSSDFDAGPLYALFEIDDKRREWMKRALSDGNS